MVWIDEAPSGCADRGFGYLLASLLCADQRREDYYESTVGHAAGEIAAGSRLAQEEGERRHWNGEHTRQAEPVN